MNLIFYFAIERIPIGLAVTLEFIGPLVVAVVGSRLLDCYGSFVATGIVLIAPWSDNGVESFLGVVFALAAGALWAAHCVGRKSVQR
jgi:inner membrane transporter RhtA